MTSEKNVTNGADEKCPNILVFVLDSVRSQNMSIYGYDRVTTPFLEEFVEQCTIYHDATSPGVWSLPSHVSMLTGLHAEQHYIDTIDDRLAPGNTFVEDLSSRGYDTAVFSQNVWLTHVDVGIRDVFDETFASQQMRYPQAIDPTTAEFEDYWEFLQLSLASDHTLKSVVNGIRSKLKWDYPRLYSAVVDDQPPVAAYLDSFLEWSADRDRWMALVNLMDAHSPYLPEEEFDEWGDREAREIQEDVEDGVWEFLCGCREWHDRERLMDLYDGAIKQLDHYLGAAIEALEERGDLEETLVIITSDHGEGFGERTRLQPGYRAAGHAIGLHRVQTHVPLIVHRPDQTKREDIHEYASLVKLPSIVQGAVRGQRCSAVPDGPVLASSFPLHGKIMPRRANDYCEDVTPFKHATRAIHLPNEGRFVRRADHEIRTGQDEWEDAEEVSGGSRVRPVFDELKDAGVRETSSGKESLDVATERSLRDLGYL